MYGVMKEREYGIDLLRIIAMYFVVVVHIFNLGGVLENVEFLSGKYITISILRTIGNCAVDIFAILSGYVCYQSQSSNNLNSSMRRIFSLWKGVLFYSIIITMIFYFLDFRISHEVWVMTFFPTLSGEYWYFSSYVLASFFAPFIVIAIAKFEKRTFEKIWACCLLYMSVMQVLFKEYDAFDLDDGYSGIWLLILFTLGTYVAHYRPLSKINKYKIGLICLYLILISWGISTGLGLISKKWLGEVKGYNIFSSYTSPTAVGFAFFMLVFFSRISIKNLNVIRVIRVLSSSSFGVYLIHTHPLIREYLLNGAYRIEGYESTIIIILVVLISAIAMYLVCSVIELGRRRLFDIFENRLLKRKKE